MYAALLAGDAEGGDSRGKQSAALLVVKEATGYGGYTDRAIDIRVDDHGEPFKELGRILNIAQMNYAWNEAWTLFTQQQFAEALPHMERTAKLAPEYPEVLYDLAVIRLAAGNKATAMDALKEALRLNPKLTAQASKDNDLAGLHGDPEFEALVE
jgi:tetratricopeptide (TPR) repeat protein